MVDGLFDANDPRATSRVWLEWCFHELTKEFSNALRDSSIDLRFVVPIPHTSIAVTKKKIAVQIGAYNARLLLGPPWSLEWPPVALTN